MMRSFSVYRTPILLLVFILMVPYIVAIQQMGEDVSLTVMTPLWLFNHVPPDHDSYLFAPMSFIYIIWFFPSLYVPKLAYDAYRKDDVTRWLFAKRMVIVTIAQALIPLFFPPISGYPPVFIIPVPIAPVVALALTRFIVPPKTEIWSSDVQDAMQ